MKRLFVVMLCLFGVSIAVHAQSVGVTITFDAGSGIASGSAIQLASFKIGAVQPQLSLYTGGGASAGKSQFTPLTLYKTIDETTPLLFLDCALGKLIKGATLTVTQNPQQAPVVLFQILLYGVFISSVNDDNTNSDGGPPFETVTLSYQKIGWQYTPPGGGNPVNGAFDNVRNIQESWSQLLNQVGISAGSPQIAH